MRKLIATAIAIAIAATLAVLVPTAASAQEPKFLSDVTILDAVVDMDTHIVTVTVTVTCLMDIPDPGFVHGGAVLTQSEGSGRLASATQKGFGANGCLAGQVLVFPILFGGQQGTFLPGPAEIHGFVEAIGPDFRPIDVVSIGPATVLLHPAPPA